MDKLYTLPFISTIQSPKKETLRFIVQFASSYKPIETSQFHIDYIAN